MSPFSLGGCARRPLGSCVRRTDQRADANIKLYIQSRCRKHCADCRKHCADALVPVPVPVPVLGLVLVLAMHTMCLLSTRSATAPITGR
ncbi:unnamed protein product [Soboliphyme baturini]|uniref:ShKT domain-containing protein n=1 Tax=Soboliphyme baturini TaxID=241478 RepID=A0A183IMI0_9BILA|nr:unnamed protein product [Soboliphyme baturini]